MKDLSYLDEHRVEVFGQKGDKHSGMFELNIRGEKYRVVASDGHGWQHVSVSSKHKVPSWKTMCTIKDMFFEEEEMVMQLHPPKSEHINNHANCLHLWKPTNTEIPAPPSWMVGVKGLEMKR